ncbi:hypothetical protein HYFRA_00012136 [Hymenoscyphus fraxineus]|uniref:Uncharacterized protein n=1 Tax=Hymenoscyphus fraxineus TaxID=746836 RepID=A0A9N9L3U7_9HELO|nr:hypothetical protein HYFRA_00012136 [Hymenoscyphus fraxineus]
MTRQNRWAPQESKERKKWVRKGAEGEKERKKNAHVAPKSWVIARQDSMAATRKGDQGKVKKMRRVERKEKRKMGKFGGAAGDEAGRGDGEELGEGDEEKDKEDEEMEEGMNDDDEEDIDDDSGLVVEGEAGMEGGAADDGKWKDECVMRFKNN